MLTDKIRDNLENTLKNANLALLADESGEYRFRKMFTSRSTPRELLILNYRFNKKTSLYAEGYQMLCQFYGTFDKVACVGRCADDRSPYSPLENKEYRLAHNYILLAHDNSYVLLGFTSCQKYNGFFRIYEDGMLQMGQSTESLTFEIGDIVESEFFVILEGISRRKLLERYAAFIEKHHPKRGNLTPFMGFSTAYAYYDKLSSKAVLEDVKTLGLFPSLSYVQLDDGYQSHMGDWLCPSHKFSDGLAHACQHIQKLGKKVGLWLAPFIVSGESELIKEHPEWLHTDMDGNLVPAGYLTYGGWRDTPWYVLDFGVQEVVDHVFCLFSTLKCDYGIDYFKLDALYWGAMKGLLYRGHETSVEHYRRALDTIRCAVGEDAILEGINAPLWPSLGLLDIMRVGDNTERMDERIVHKCKENFSRLWMHHRLWTNDADALCLKSLEDRIVTYESYKMQLALMLVVGGPILLSDPLSFYTEYDRALFAKMLMVIKNTLSVDYEHSFESFTLHLKNGSRIFIEFNFTRSQQEIILNSGAKDFLNGTGLGSKVLLKPNDVLIAEYR